MARSINILGIVGSPHKDGMTHELVQQALAGARAAGAETQILYLADEPLQPCIGCGGNCWDTQACLHDDAATTRAAQLQAADGLVMAVPVYCWQLNGLTALFIDKMRWDTGSVMAPHNTRAALGMACAGGSGTGCVLALQALYRYFYNWAFRGLPGLPVTRFNFRQSLADARAGGEALAQMVREGAPAFSSVGAAMAHLDSLPYMRYGALDELALIVEQLKAGLGEGQSPLQKTLWEEAAAAELALRQGDRERAAEHLSRAYAAGNEAWES